MRLARMLLLAATVSVVAVAIFDAAAFGQSIEVGNEATGLPCADVQVLADHQVEGGCEVHATSEGLITTFNHNGVNELLTSQCEQEFTANIAADGSGYIPVDDSTISTDPGSGCIVTPCDEPSPPEPSDFHDELEWPISAIEEYGGGQEVLVFTFCIRASNTAEGSTGLPCTIIADISQSDHQWELSVDQEPCFEDPATEISGHWVAEDEQECDEVGIELEHIHYP